MASIKSTASSDGREQHKTTSSSVRRCGMSLFNSLSQPQSLNQVFSVGFNGNLNSPKFQSSIFGTVVPGLLTSEASTTSQASNTLKELINFHIRRNYLTIDNESVDDEVKHSMESSAVKSTCAIFENVLSSCVGVPNEQSLVVISTLFRKLVKKSVIQEELQAYAHGCWGSLPAFCRHPTDTYQNFGSLVKLLITFITKDSFMLENIAIALQELVNQNKTVVRSNEGTGAFTTLPKTSEINDSSVVFESKPPDSKKIASRNIKALASCSKELIQALVDVFFGSPPEKRACLKIFPE